MFEELNTMLTFLYLGPFYMKMCSDISTENPGRFYVPFNSL